MAQIGHIIIRNKNKARQKFAITNRVVMKIKHIAGVKHRIITTFWPNTFGMHSGLELCLNSFLL